MLSFCARTIRAALDVELVEFNGEADHMHLLGGYPPALAISTLVHRLKGRTAYAVRHAFTRPLRPRPHARTPLLAVPLRRLLPQRTAAAHQARSLRGPGNARR